MRYSIFVCGLGIIALTGCATAVAPETTGGSRADGTVKLSYEYGLFQKPVVDWNQAQVSAAQSCKVWGYTSAQKFGGGEQHCEQADMYGNCIRMMVTVSYQCTGHPS